jgi:NAD-dependent SIR2 family protein deacetylase
LRGKEREEKADMITNLGIEENKEWKCLPCDCLLKLDRVRIDYMNGSFTVELPLCPSCGMVLVPEEIAVGKMLEVEKLLEDK